MVAEGTVGLAPAHGRFDGPVATIWFDLAVNRLQRTPHPGFLGSGTVWARAAHEWAVSANESGDVPGKLIVGVDRLAIHFGVGLR